MSNREPLLHPVAIRDLKPTIWAGMGSYGLHLANLAEARGIDLSKSAVRKIIVAAEPLSPAKLEDFLGAIVQVYGPKMLRYKGVLFMKGSDRKVIFQGVHQLMGSDLGPKWMPTEKKQSKMVFIGIDLPKDVLLQGLEQCLS